MSNSESLIAPLDSGTLTGLTLDNNTKDHARSISSAPLGPSQSHPAPIPPGLSSTQDFPPLAAPSQPPVPFAPKLQRKVTTKSAAATIKPVVPVISANAPGKPLTRTLHPLADKTSSDSQDAESTSKAVFEPNDGTEMSQAMSKSDGKRPESKDDNISAPGTLKTSEKRGRPEKLDLRLEKQTPDQRIGDTASEETMTKVIVDQKSHNQTISQPTTPATTSSAPDSARKSQTRTMQVTEIFKQDTASPGAVPSQASGQVSRRPSITSLTRPETPISEKVSDNLSYTSASISRTNSPPPSKIGSAPTRRVTKSQQKKERQGRAKKAGEEASQKEEPVLRSEEPVVQAPIVGRKKKTKKTKEKTGMTADSTPTVTRPPSPEMQEKAAKVLPSPQAGDAVKGLKESNKQIRLPPIASLDPETSTSATALPSVPESDQGNHIQSTVASIFASLRASGELPSNVIDTLFKAITSASHRLDQHLDPQVILNSKFDTLKLDQVARLDNDEPVVTVLDSNNAVLILPNRRYLKGLTPTQANRYRELYMQGARASISPSSKEDQDLLDLLMPIHEFSGDRAPVPALGSADSKTTTQLNNRFAEPMTPQAIPPTQSSVRIDASVSRRSGKSSMGLEEAELALAVERKNTEALEKRLNALIRKNRRLVLGSGN